MRAIAGGVVALGGGRARPDDGGESPKRPLDCFKMFYAGNARRVLGVT